MTTLNQFVERLRRELGDTDAVNALWTQEALEHHLSHALELLSQASPRQLKTALTAPGDSRDLDIAALAGRLGVEAVEYPAGQYPASYPAFSVWGDTLTLLVDSLPAAGETVNVYWTAPHTLDPEGGTVPSTAEHLVVLGASAFAALEQAASAVNRVNAGGDAVAERYRAWGEERLAEFQQGLAERRRRRGLLPRRLYAPVAAAPSQTTDWGP